MREHTWIVSFPAGTGTITINVSAGCEEAAKILAQAEQIKAGNEWREIKSIIKRD
jgi:hypothetical protein